uniref:E3 UFM1-protein ligase 1 n=1 Tax=Denticeps clupeoides TaxID=299321 RepID=A0AAY4BEJ7_9TELE
MDAGWEEIRRLAADFQRAQFADTVQRLSERNCIEIVAKLVAEKKVDVVHTLDGKEYVTPGQICREIRDELYVHGGRINIVDLQKIINVDLVHIEARANEIARSDRATQLVLGQLIDEKYLNGLAEEVNDKLQEAGQVNIAEVCKNYDLPGDFLTQELSSRLGKVIQGQMDQYDRGVIFTEAFLSRHKARIRGLFSAVTRPTPVSSLIGLHGFQEHLLYSVLEELVNGGRLKGTVVGGRQDKAIYIPDIYSRTQSNWVDSFLRQNGYLEFEALTRLGIPDPVSYIKRRFKSNKLLFLRTACVGQAIVDQVEASVEEVVSSATWADVQPILPSCLSTEDIGILINQVMRTTNVQSVARVLCDAVVVSEKFVSNCLALFEETMQLRAQKEIKNNPVFLISEDDAKQAAALPENTSASRKDKREERRKKASEGGGSVKGGGLGNAREIRIRKTKKKGGRRDEDSDEDAASTAQGRSKQAEIPFLAVDEVVAALEQKVCDCPEDVLSELAEQLMRPLTKAYQEVVRSAFLSSSASSSGSKRKQNVKDLQEEITNLYNNIRLFEKGTKLFSDETQANIAKHVLKTVCTDVTNSLVTFAASDSMISADCLGSLTSESIEEFTGNLETSAEVCGLLLKKGDKKRERQALFQHRQALTEQLKLTEDPALVLHLTSVLLFQAATHCMLHAPGRCVPQVIGSLVGKISEEQHRLLSRYQALVVKQLVGQSQAKKAGEAEDPADGEEVEAVQRELHTLTAEVKDLVLSQKKHSVTEE